MLGAHPIEIHIDFLFLDKIRHIDIPITLLLHTYANKNSQSWIENIFSALIIFFLFNIFFCILVRFTRLLLISGLWAVSWQNFIHSGQ